MGANNSKRRGQMVSIDIGSRGVKFAVGEAYNNRIKLVGCHAETLPADAYENGVILKFDVVQQVITEALRKNHIKPKNAILSIESSEMIKREMIVQRVPIEDMISLITYEVKQYLPIDTTNYVIQYKELPPDEGQEASKIKVLMGALPNDMVEAHINLLEACGLKPTAMDMHSNGLEKLVKWMRQNETYSQAKSCAYIDLGHKMIDISIFENGEYKFNRIVKMGGYDFDKVLMHHLDVDLAESERRKMKLSAGALKKAMESGKLDTYLSDDENLKATVIKDSLMFFDDVVDEINKVFKYYTSRSSDNKIDQVFIFGGTSRFKDISTLIQEKLELPTELLKTINCVEGLSKTGNDDLSLYVNAIGALIRY